MNQLRACGLWSFVLLVVWFLGCTSPGGGEAGRGGKRLESLHADAKRFVRRVIKDGNDVFLRGDNMTALLLAGGGSIAMHNSDADDNINENFEGIRTFKDFTDESLNVVGSGLFHFAGAGLWYIFSADTGDEVNKERALTMLRALSLTNLSTLAFKGLRDNETPNGKDWAWPSGHTSSSFCVASVLDEYYGPWVGIPAYGGASVVAWRMMDTGDHWASDVLFGATLGWVVGHTVGGKGKDMEIAGFKVVPYMGESGGGVAFMRRF